MKSKSCLICTLVRMCFCFWCGRCGMVWMWRDVMLSTVLWWDITLRCDEVRRDELRWGVIWHSIRFNWCERQPMRQIPTELKVCECSSKFSGVECALVELLSNTGPTIITHHIFLWYCSVWHTMRLYCVVYCYTWNVYYKHKVWVSEVRRYMFMVGFP